MAIAAVKLKDEVSSWPGISVHPHRFAAREYRFGRAEVGHVHFWGDVDIPFPRPVHDWIIAQNLAEQHRWVPDSGWTTFRIRAQEGVEHAIWLMRLSYLRYLLRSAAKPAELLASEAERLHLSPDLVRILSSFTPAGAKSI
ncbi:luciferase domain-containing protein [Occallatibacter riparius]|uniref:DUF5519 family protein n=1 Tax=Occallatibacter riparius TaxID=1002689 RepID=A0A9J7BQZ2_9BACT|nr:luciferase family protein [Occallatibacter riparius]UWZ84162.1 DUF5519 family protein [Occallatibacter riparius]